MGHHINAAVHHQHGLRQREDVRRCPQTAHVRLVDEAGHCLAGHRIFAALHVELDAVHATVGKLVHGLARLVWRLVGPGARAGGVDARAVEIDLVLLVTQRDDFKQVVLPLSQAHHRRDTVVGVHLEPPDKVVPHRHGVGEVLDVPVGVDDAWHDGLA